MADERVHVNFLAPEEGTSSDLPSLLLFPQGPPPVLSLDAADIRFRLFGHTDPRKAHQRVVTADTPLANYRYAVGVYKRERDSVQVLPARVYTMMQQQAEPAEEPRSSMTTAETYRAQQAMLVERFGSKKRKRDVKARAANTVAVEHGTALGAVNKILEEKHEAPATEAETLDSIKRPVLPEYDLEATTIGAIYPISGIISAAEWKVTDPKPLLKVLSTKNEAKAAASSGYEGLVLRLLADAKAAGRTKDDLENVCRLLQYLHTLMQFKKLPDGRKMRDLARMELPELVRDSLREKFSEKMQAEGKIRDAHTPQMRDKLLYHLLILALSASGFRLNTGHIDLLCKDLGMLNNTVVTYFREAGCSYSRDEGVALKAPLVLPGLRTNKRQRR